MNINTIDIPIEYINASMYKISRTIDIIHRVSLGSKDKNGKRYSFLKNDYYDSGKYTDVKKLCSATIRKEDYLCIKYCGFDKLTDADWKLQISFPQHFYYTFINYLRTVYQWFTDPKFKDLYIYDDNTGNIKELNFKYAELISKISTPIVFDNNYSTLSLKPAVIHDSNDSTLKYEGLFVYLDRILIGTITAWELEGFIQFLATYNMAQVGYCILTSLIAAKTRADILELLKTK